MSYSLAIEGAGGCASYLAGTGTVRTRENSVVAGPGLRGTTPTESNAIAGIGRDASSVLNSLTAQATFTGTPCATTAGTVAAGEDPIVTSSGLGAALLSKGDLRTFVGDEALSTAEQGIVKLA